MQYPLKGAKNILSNLTLRRTWKQNGRQRKKWIRNMFTNEPFVMAGHDLVIAKGVYCVKCDSILKVVKSRLKPISEADQVKDSNVCLYHDFVKTIHAWTWTYTIGKWEDELSCIADEIAHRNHRNCVIWSSIIKSWSTWTTQEIFKWLRIRKMWRANRNQFKYTSLNALFKCIYSKSKCTV